MEVWVASDFPEDQIPNVKRAIKFWNSIANVKLIFKGKTSYTSDEMFYKQGCYWNINLPVKGIVVLEYPQSCGIVRNERGNAFVPAGYTLQGRTEELVYVGIVEGERDLTTYIHEFGHAIGLKHPFEFGEPDTGDNPVYSIMQYTYRVIGARSDVEVAQYLYGQPTDNYPMEIYEYNTADNYMHSRTYRGVCVFGGVYPFNAYVVEGDCTLKPTMDESQTCWEVYEGSSENCTIEVSDSKGETVRYTVAKLVTPFEPLPPSEGSSQGSSGSGGGGGCNTGSYEMAIAGLLAFLGKVIRRRIRRKSI
ncbi:MAG: hypothetical protein DSY32_02635 [Aquifex sp.]|nr:MAG: hypothetical protein DSY32_02635 [Aquifex sp.]